MSQAFAITVFIAGTVACSGAAFGGPEVEPRSAILQFHSDPVQIDLPDTATAASAFPVSVRSYGDGCRSRGDTLVNVEGLLATIQPFDLVPTDPNAICTRMLQVFEHAVRIRFDQRGTATVRVLGRREPGDQPVSVDRAVVVR